MVSGNPDQLPKAGLQNIKREFKMRFGLADVAGQNEPVVAMICHSQQRVAIGIVTKVQVADGMQLHSTGNFT
jgi:hypothetical protein